MEKTVTFTPQGVCARSITFVTEDNKVKSVRFEGGCPGNSIAVGNLVSGMEVSEVIRRLKGIHCGMKQTSCADQFACALEEATREEENPGTVSSTENEDK